MEVWEPRTASSSGEDANAIDQNLRNTSEGAAPDGEMTKLKAAENTHFLWTRLPAKPGEISDW